MAVVEVLEQLGGVATRSALLACCDRKAVDRAVAAGDLVVVARGRYALPAAEEATVAAHRVRGVCSHRSAALKHGWPVLVVPEAPDVTVPKHRQLRKAQRRGVTLHWADLAADEVEDGRTTRERTLVDCLRTLPLVEALAVADSALREGFDPGRLRRIARSVRGRGRPQVLRVARLASPLAANPFESALRGIAADVEGLDVQPQVEIHDPDFLGRPDLLDRRLGIVIEADSFEWHGKRSALASDCRRYNRFVVRGWLVLRFSWEDVMFHPDQVRDVLVAAVELRTHMLCPGCGAA